ncbi:MAG: DUF1993 domain-containing protein [Methylophilaceae bacterium]
MTISMYEASIPVFKRFLSNLSAMLTKASDYADARKIDHSVLLNARLFPDMYPLVKQVQIATDQAKGAAARLAGVEIPKFEDNESNFAELHERIAKTIAFLDSVKPEQLEGSESRDIVLTLRDKKLEFKGLQYLLTWVQPNFYFHVTTAYDILRHNGVEIGKRDFLGG